MEIPKRKVNAFWRGGLLPHLAADAFPLLSPDELGELGADIEKNHLRVPIVLWRAAPDAPLQVLDGRNRLDALARKFGPVRIVCEPIKDSGRTVTMVWSIKAGEDWIADDNKVVFLDSSIDPIAYVVSINMHRRHLTPEQRREVIANLIKLQPEKSNRQLGKLIKVDHKTVGAVRAQKESTGEISPVAKRIGADGRSRKQPAKRKTASANETEVPATTETVVPTPPEDQSHRQDIGSDSADEIARKDAEIEELRSAKRMLEIKVNAWESENEELRQQATELAGGGSLAELIELIERLRQVITDARQPAWLKPLKLHKQQQARKLFERLTIALCELINLRQAAAQAMPDIVPLPPNDDIPDFLDQTREAAR